MQSAKSWQSVVGHEISHVLEGTDTYSELRNTLYAYAESKGELAIRKAEIEELYKNIKNTDIDAELTADLIGDYLFSDKNFIKNLTTNRNLFQKIYDEIKYLCKVATGKELTEIEKVKREFDKAWKEIGKGQQAQKNTADSGVKYSIKRTKNIPYLHQLEPGVLKRSDSLYIGIPSENLQYAGFSNNPFAMNQGDLSKSTRETGNNPHYSAHGISNDYIKNLPNYINDAVMLIDNGKKVTIITSEEMKDRKGQNSLIVVGIWRDSKIDNDFVNLAKSIYPLDDIAMKIQEAVVNGKFVVINKNKANDLLARVGIQTSERSSIISLAKNTLSQIGNDVNKNSFTDEEYLDAVRKNDTTTAQKLVDEAAEQKFKDSKARDSKGKLIKVYHYDGVIVGDVQGGDVEYAAFEQNRMNLTTKMTIFG